MLLGEPHPTPYDWRFQLLGIPVLVNPYFWLVGLLLGMSLEPRLLILWLVTLFISILVHEMGHALAMRHFGFQPRVVLYSFGGLAIPDSGYRSVGGPRVGPRERILYTVAGPVAGFLFAGLVMFLILLLGGQLVLDWKAMPRFWDFELAAGGRELDLADYELLYNFIDFLLYVNIFWGMVNLLPVFPLDGGQIAREILTVNDPWQGTQKSLWLSVYTGAVVAVMAVVMLGSIYMGLMFGMLAYSSYQMLQRGGYR